VAERIVTYVHHGDIVSVREDLKGRHREHCLCWRCSNFTPDDRGNSCPIANTLYALDVLAGITTPVWECPKFYELEAKQEDTVKDAHAEDAEKKEEPAE